MTKKLAVTRDEKRILTNYFPLIKRISNKDGLRAMVIEAWVSLWRESGYRDITEAPNSLTEYDGDDDIVRHTNVVARMASAIAAELERAYGVNPDYDLLLAGALLHDVDKLVLFERKGDSVQVGELGKKVPHGQYGALVAEKIGLPREVVNIIASHSPINPMASPETIEAVIVAFCDEVSFQSYRFITGQGLLKKKS